MQHSQTITLFSAVPPSRRGPSGFAISVFMHLVVIGICYGYMRQALHVADRIASQRYNVRLINVQPPRTRIQTGGSSSGASAVSAAVSPTSSPSGMAPASLVPATAKAIRATQALVQPDLPPDLLLTKPIPLPQVVIWSPGPMPAVAVTPPPAHAANTPITTPSLEAPNDEMKIADLKISAVAFTPSVLTLSPSTTAPVVVHQPSLPSQMPSMASSALGPATPARVISLSEMQLQKGTIALPALNEVGAPDGLNDPTAEKALATNSNGEGKQGSSKSGTHDGDQGTERSSGAGNTQLASTEAGGQGDGTRNGGHGDQGNGSGSGSSTGSSPEDGPAITEIRQPMNGQFSAVVVGSSIAEKYPETMQLWAGRLAYTVYLHMGLEKNWILQYAVTREAASVAGSATQPNAPWPYLMERPHLLPGDFNSDALMVHGRLNDSGRFEALSMVFPSDFPQAQFVLSALQQWRFRPARQQGRVIAVEVLLIIPEEE